MGSIEIFVNFPVQDMNRNVLWNSPEGVDPADLQRMNAFWGDTSWQGVAYDSGRNLFGWPERTDNATIAQGFRERLRAIASFGFVAEPLPMRNSKGSVVYYLFFASPNRTGARIVSDIFQTYRDRAR
jgi:three-Cys-motif partner protein